MEQALESEIRGNYPSLGPLKNDSNKRMIINNIVNAYRQAAKGQLLIEKPELIERMEALGRKIQDVRTEVPEEDPDLLEPQGEE
jgi:hypothetical protein